ncbi:hypothetical protein [Desulfosporosinus sp.]|uniref:hypothetical protein n=1 Tax=Desulfosporosinus sp. TaxID=157907 RepID=UPI0025BD1F1A|nr:hypothetical protein [Desulfosporosinus sp.]MBC2723056.1 hypothetical protein [Desulfosporosinus sp.]MBC2728993.1 hypothetical protein [Desulfosporosinus sp.]
MISLSWLNLFKRILATLILMALVISAYLLWARPYQLNWGATEQEMNQVMPGDHLDPQPEFFSTRAITIKGTPEEIWPWLLQMGYGRAGYYGYDIIENLGSPLGIHSADHILPEFQHFKVGDSVPISSVAHMVFYAIEPNRYLIWTGTDQKGSFIWALYPLDEDHTRLVSRIRWSFHWAEPSLLSLDLFTEFTDYLAVREILQGVKGRVENQIEPMANQNTEVVIYVVTALIFIVSLVSLLIRGLTWKRWLTGLAAGVVWLVTWFAPVSIWIGVGLEILVVWKLFFPKDFFKRSKVDKAVNPA